MKRLLILAVAAIGMVVVAIVSLPLDIVLVTPLRYVVSFHAEPRQSIRTAAPQPDIVWDAIDLFAVSRGLRFHVPAAGIERVQSSYYSDEGFSIIAMVLNGAATISFYSAPPKTHRCNHSLPTSNIR